jgi:hypothetical protein
MTDTLFEVVTLQLTIKKYACLLHLNLCSTLLSPYYYESSSFESSVLNRQTPFSFIEIPNITLIDYCRIIQNEETFDELMATIGY